LVYAIAHGELERPLEAPATTDSSERQRVVMHNDDFTPMMLVVELLMRELALDQTQATELMVRVHREGSAECGSWPANEAHRIAQAIITGARAAHYPLRVMLR
jgi:ATP-dependent Clp protease adaptor protein ClpS